MQQCRASEARLTTVQDRLVDEGYNPAYGARPLRRAIMRLLEDSMAERMLAGDIKARPALRCIRADHLPVLGQFAARWPDGCQELPSTCAVAKPLHAGQ